MADIEYEMELLAASSDPADRDKALTYFQNRLIKQEKKDGNKAVSWQRKTAAEIMATDYPDIQWAVEGIIPEGLSIITAPPKACKSWLALSLSTAVSHGGCFMGSIQVSQKTVLYLALEDNERRIKDHLLIQGGLANDRLFIETPHSWKGGIGALRSYLEEFPETGLVIIDTLFKFQPLEDSNEYSKTYKPIALLQELASKYNLAIVLVHHTRKGSHGNTGEGWADEGLGSTGIIGAVDTIISIQKKDGKPEGTMRIKGRDVEEKCLDIIFDKDICTWRIIGESEIVKGDPKAQAEVLSLLEKNPEGLRTGDIASMLGKKDNAVCNILNALNKKGKALKNDNNKWVFTHFHNTSQMKESENVNSQIHFSLEKSENVNSELELY